MCSYCIFHPFSTSYFCSGGPQKYTFQVATFRIERTISLSRLAKVLKLISLCNLQPRTKELCWRLLDSRLLAKTAYFLLLWDFRNSISRKNGKESRIPWSGIWNSKMQPIPTYRPFPLFFLLRISQIRPFLKPRFLRNFGQKNHRTNTMQKSELDAKICA